MLYLEVSDQMYHMFNMAVYKSSDGVCSFADASIDLYDRAPYYELNPDNPSLISISDPLGECNVKYMNNYWCIDFHNTLYAAIPDEKLDNPKGIVMGYIKNVGLREMKITFSWGRYVWVIPGNEIEIVYDSIGQEEIDEF